MRIAPLPALLAALVTVALAGCASVPASSTEIRLGAGSRIEIDLPVAGGGGLFIRNDGPSPVACAVRTRSGLVLSEGQIGYVQHPDLARASGGEDVVLLIEGPASGDALLHVRVTGDAAVAWEGFLSLGGFP